MCCGVPSSSNDPIRNDCSAELSGRSGGTPAGGPADGAWSFSHASIWVRCDIWGPVSWLWAMRRRGPSSTMRAWCASMRKSNVSWPERAACMSRSTERKVPPCWSAEWSCRSVVRSAKPYHVSALFLKAGLMNPHFSRYRRWSSRSSGYIASTSFCP